MAGTWFNIWIGNSISSIPGSPGRGPDNGNPNANLYTWQPNINTKGSWQTVVIPWNEFFSYASRPKNGYDFKYSPDGYDISIVLQGPNSATVQYLAIDNLRVVPNKIN